MKTMAETKAAPMASVVAACLAAVGLMAALSESVDAQLARLVRDIDPTNRLPTRLRRGLST